MKIIRLPQGINLQGLLWGIYRAGQKSANAPELASEGTPTKEDCEFEAKDLMRQLTSNQEVV